ncbi:hypothetical protein GQ600_6329 [Phytophthora cactorum]|nr:hypothetical protein GQ600_6329 [Phytophthora cactorum]
MFAHEAISETLPRFGMATEQTHQPREQDYQLHSGSGERIWCAPHYRWAMHNIAVGEELDFDYGHKRSVGPDWSRRRMASTDPVKEGVYSDHMWVDSVFSCTRYVSTC